MKKAFNVAQLERMKEKTMGLTGEWREAFGDPPVTGIWFIWGNSGSGKSSFVMQLTKVLCSIYKKVIYDSMEEAVTLSFRRRLKTFGMEEVKNRLIVLPNEHYDDLMKRIEQKAAPKAIIIDSWQYSEASWIDYKKMKERHRDKLFVIISHADGRMPRGRSANSIMYDADVKIYVEGYRAICKGRFTPAPGSFFTIWKEGADRYWGEKQQQDASEDYEGADYEDSDDTTEEGL